MSEAQPTSPVSPEADNSGDIYNPVLRTIAQSEQRAALVPGLVRALLQQRRALCISLVANGIQYWHATGVTREYFATDNGRLVRLAPTSQPGWSQSDVMNFGQHYAERSLQSRFVHDPKTNHDTGPPLFRSRLCRLCECPSGLEHSRHY